MWLCCSPSSTSISIDMYVVNVFIYDMYKEEWNWEINILYLVSCIVYLFVYYLEEAPCSGYQDKFHNIHPQMLKTNIVSTLKQYYFPNAPRINLWFSDGNTIIK